MILEAARIFGGDSGYYCLGDYYVFRDRFEASVRITKHNQMLANLFGDDSPQFDIRALGNFKNGTITTTNGAP